MKGKLLFDGAMSVGHDAQGVAATVQVRQDGRSAGQGNVWRLAKRRRDGCDRHRVGVLRPQGLGYDSIHHIPVHLFDANCLRVHFSGGGVDRRHAYIVVRKEAVIVNCRS